MMNYMNHKFYRKHIAWMYLLLLVIGTIASLMIPKQEMAAAEDPLIIPEEAIRLRIIPNSDSDTDQEAKRAIRDAVNAEITKWVEELTSIDEARSVITSHLPDVDKIAQQELAEKGLNYSVKVEFGNVQFPTKLYGQYLYPAGTYEAILITLGEGSGANWWCVLFPPLCFLDFSNSLAVSPGFDEEDVDKADVKAKKQSKETAVVDKPVENKRSSHSAEKNVPFTAEKEDEVEVKFFLVELFNKLF
ncbi:stage II sporulation protein R [Lederbergia citrea]|nr:stage II sporulation protein R [Lederbergia citrea]